MIRDLICRLFGHGGVNVIRQISPRYSRVECRRCGHIHLKEHK